MAAALKAKAPRLTDLKPPADDVLGDVLAGLTATPKKLPSKYFYDARGSALFEKITLQPEYYLTRDELELLEEKGSAIAKAVGPDIHVIEYGSGSAQKTQLLLQALETPAAYTPVEISRSALLASVQAMQTALPDLCIQPVCADFTQPIDLPSLTPAANRRLMFFPGSTLGNFDRRGAVALLAGMRRTAGSRGLALIGIDLVKSSARIEAAYNDAAGVTAAFTLNLLERLNRELGADFNLAQFRHRAIYVESRCRIETYIDSLRDQTVHVGGQAISFAADEAMQVELSHKYSDADFESLASAAGWRVTDGWNSHDEGFGLRLLAAS